MKASRGTCRQRHVHESNGAHTLLRVALGGTQTIDAPLNLVSVEGDEAGSLYI